MAKPPETRFASSDGVDIAYQVIGDGDRDIVMTMGWVTHLELMWELPELAFFLDRLAGMGRLIIFDKRGTELSDRVPGMVTLEQRAEDVGAVVNAGLRHAHTHESGSPDERKYLLLAEIRAKVWWREAQGAGRIGSMPCCGDMAA